MKQFMIGCLLGSLLTATPVLAFHYFGHDSGMDEINRMQQQQERFNQGVERQQQELFRQQQRMNPC